MMATTQKNPPYQVARMAAYAPARCGFDGTLQIDRLAERWIIRCGPFDPVGQSGLLLHTPGAASKRHVIHVVQSAEFNDEAPQTCELATCLDRIPAIMVAPPVRNHQHVSRANAKNNPEAEYPWRSTVWLTTRCERMLHPEGNTLTAVRVSRLAITKSFVSGIGTIRSS